MLNLSFVFLKLLCALLLGISEALQPITKNNHVLVGHVFQQLYARDWFNCIQACHDEPRCISYNYERSAGVNGLCELNDCGIDTLCGTEKSLIYSKGFVFQQIRKGKVSLSAKAPFIKWRVPETTLSYLKLTLDYSIKVMNNYAGSVLTRPTGTSFSHMMLNKVASGGELSRVP